MRIWQLFVLIVAIILVTIWLSGGFAPAEKAPAVIVPVVPTSAPQVKDSVPVVKTATEVEVVIPDTVEHFYDLATFYIDGDPKVQGFKTQGIEMKYTCENDFGVFITMDPGIVNGQSTGDLGAVFFVVCDKGDVVTLSTEYWSTSALHQQIHLVEFTQEITDVQALNFLKVLKIDEGKEIAFFIDGTGKVTKY